MMAARGPVPPPPPPPHMGGVIQHNGSPPAIRQYQPLPLNQMPMRPQQQQQIQLRQPRQFVNNLAQSHKSSRLLQSMELFARQKLTVYESYTFHLAQPPPAGTENEDGLVDRSPTWLRVTVTRNQFEQADVLKKINELEKTGPSVTTKSSDLTFDQHRQVTKLLDDKTRTEINSSFAWILVQLEVKLFRDTIRSWMDAESITVYVKREPRHFINATIMYQKMRMQRSIETPNANPYQQNPQYQQKQPFQLVQESQPLDQGVQGAGGMSGTVVLNTTAGKLNGAKEASEEPASKVGGKQGVNSKSEPQKAKEKAPLVDDLRGKPSRLKSPIQLKSKYTPESLNFSDSTSDLMYSTDSDSDSDSESDSGFSSTANNAPSAWLRGRHRQAARQHRASSRSRDSKRDYVSSKKAGHGMDVKDEIFEAFAAGVDYGYKFKSPPRQSGYFPSTGDADGDGFGHSLGGDRQDWDGRDYRFPEAGFFSSRRGMEYGNGYGGYSGYRSGVSDSMRDDFRRWDEFSREELLRDAELRRVRDDIRLREEAEERTRRAETFESLQERPDLMKDRIGSANYRGYR